MENLKHIRFITENYAELQGLRQIPLSICMGAVGVLSIASRLDVITGWGTVLGMLVLIGLGYATYEWIGKRYNDLYGNVQSRKSGIPDATWTGVAIVVFIVEVFAQLPLSPSMFVIAVFFLYRWYMSQGLLPHYLPLAFVLMFGIAIPQIVHTDDRVAWFLILLGTVQAIAGVFDHLALTRILRRPTDDEA